MYHSRGFRRRSTGPRPVVHTYKKVLNFSEASFGAGFNNQIVIQGKDNINPKQTNPTDGEVPTGARVKYFEVQVAIVNLVSTPCYVNCSIQYKLSGQSFIDPNIIGGDPQRNQVLHQDMYSVGQNQNSNHKFKFKIPKKFQRLREGMQWALTWSNNVTVNQQAQVIYKMEY